MGHPQIKNIMNDLHLNGMLNAFQDLSDKCTKNSWTAAEFVDQLLQAELEWRENQNSERKIKCSKLPRLPSLEDFDFVFRRNITKSQIRELYSLKWLDQARPLILVGPTGIGKTFIAEALGHHICQRRKSLLYLSMSDLLEQQHLAHLSGTYLKYKARLSKFDVIILDDLGLRKLSTQEAHDLNEILKERQGKKSLIITTQLPIENWPEILEDPIIADTIIDQLKNISLTITLAGPSYREELGKRFDTTSKLV
jgi:DNA replication protein DnaC